jgi:hypothetical protein
VGRTITRDDHAIVVVIRLRFSLDDGMVVDVLRGSSQRSSGIFDV